MHEKNAISLRKRKHDEMNRHFIYFQTPNESETACNIAKLYQELWHVGHVARAYIFATTYYLVRTTPYIILYT